MSTTIFHYDAQVVAIFGGFSLSLFGLCGAIVWRDPYWYSHFVVGLFLLFDGLNEVVFGEGLLGSGRERGRKLTLLYGVHVGFALVLDLLLGRYIGNFWTYPHYSAWEQLLHVFLIGYPFALLSVGVSYRFCVDVLESTYSLVSLRPQERTPRKILVAKILLVVLAASVLLVPLLHFLAAMDSRRLMVVLLLLNLSTSLPASYLCSEGTLFGQILEGNASLVVITVVFSLVTALLHEVPNTYVWAWRYQNTPFVTVEFLEVNVLVLTAGWLFLATYSIGTIEWVRCE